MLHVVQTQAAVLELCQKLEKILIEIINSLIKVNKIRSKIRNLTIYSNVLFCYGHTLVATKGVLRFDTRPYLSQWSTGN